MRILTAVMRLIIQRCLPDEIQFLSHMHSDTMAREGQFALLGDLRNTTICFRQPDKSKKRKRRQITHRLTQSPLSPQPSDAIATPRHLSPRGYSKQVPQPPARGFVYTRLVCTSFWTAGGVDVICASQAMARSRARPSKPG
ncbi:hypothetical protein BJ322DRAFT_599440 [Thelephora terrestris]|uniref:Uncharacterized protein n=1 Tax=Thelephora terrestris TaxID=56493 RepID=A0A9P6HJB0_9AGAM|nr:hypothetical protein BJ322DRAFT_599440 [Thelephora terrestris]